MITNTGTRQETSVASHEMAGHTGNRAPAISREAPNRQEAPSWNPSPYVLLRFAGKPFEELERLKFSRTVALIEQILDLRRWIDEHKARLCDLLFNAIGTHSGPARGQLVAIKRSIYNERIPPRSHFPILRSLGDPELRGAILGFFWKQRRLERWMRRGQATFAEELAEKRRLLRESLADPNFQKGVQIASPALFAGLREYMATDPTALRAHDRQAEAGAFRYFTRMTAKTSPFGRFGPVALAVADMQAACAIDIQAAGLAMRSTASFNLGVITALATSLSYNPQIQRQLCPRVNGTYFIDGQDIVFVRPKMVEDLAVYSSIHALRRGKYLPPIRQVVEFLERHAGAGLTLAEVIEQLANHAPPDSAAYQKTEAFLLKLIQSGLIINEFRLPSNSLNRLEVLRHRVMALGAQACPDTTALRRLDECARNFAVASVGERQHIFQEARQLVDELMRWWQPESKARAQRSDFLVEDAAAEGMRVQLGSRFFRPILGDIGAFLECVYARDRGGLTYVMLKDIFTATYGNGGRCDNLMAFAAEYMRMTSESDLADPALYKRASLVNQQTIDYMKVLGSAVTSTRTPPERELPRELIEQLTCSFGGPVHGPLAMALNLQVAAESLEALEHGDYLVALNYTLPGFGHFFTRYCHVFEQEPGAFPLAQSIRERVERLGAELPGGYELIELLSVLDHNAQLHPCFTEREIVPPGEISALPKAKQITIQRLEIAHDEQSDELQLFLRDPAHLDDPRQRVIPLYMGFFHMMALPSIHRLLANLSPTAYHMERLKPNEHLENLIPFMTNDPLQALPVRHYPRLRLGKLVLQRETWAFPTASLPSPAAEDDFTRFLKTYAWARRYELPKEVFVRIRRDRMKADIDYQTDHKPMMIDFENYFSLQLFFDMLGLSDIDAVHIEEMLPNPRQLCFTLNNQRYAVEFQIELNRGVRADD